MLGHSVGEIGRFAAFSQAMVHAVHFRIGVFYGAGISAESA